MSPISTETGPRITSKPEEVVTKVYSDGIKGLQRIRKTTGVNTALEYVISPKSTLYLKGMYGTLSDDETHYKHRVRFDKFSSANNTARVELQNIHNLLITELKSVSLGGIHTLNKSKIEWDLSIMTISLNMGIFLTNRTNPII